MRLSFVDITIAAICLAFGYLAVFAIGQSRGDYLNFEAWTSIAAIIIGAILFLVLASPIYNKLGLLPLFLPVCPHCKRRPDSYRTIESDKVHLLVACGNCDQAFELWWKPPTGAEVSQTIPSLLLCWPQSVGRWKLIPKKDGAP